MTQKKKMMEVKNLSLIYHEPSGETKAIDNVSFSVDEGEFLSIIGPSGCGKSSLLSVIAGLLAPSSGQVVIHGDNECKNIGYMLQKDHLFGWRNILNNVYLGLEVQNKLTEENKKYAAGLLDTYGLKDFKTHLPFQLSGGMRQRAALIRTLALRPEILLLDEPFSALDYQTRLYVGDDIGTIIKKENKTAILVTHDISEAVSLSDRIIVLTKRPGKIKAIHEIKLSVDEKTPMKAREAVEFKDYFNMIWKELDVHV